MTTTRWIFCLFAAALLCCAMLLIISDLTVVPLVARGSGPDGVQVTTSGWAAFLISLLGTCGFSLSGLIIAVVHYLRWPEAAATHSTAPDAPFVSQIVELTESFTALLADRDSRAAQRRFVFALVDSAGLIQGCQTSHDNGVIVIKYTGYADPVVVLAPVQGGTQ